MATRKKKSTPKTGVVKSFNEKRGVGFIDDEDTDDQFVVHYRDIALPGYAVLVPGQRVEFEAADDDSSEPTAAQNVRPASA